MLEVQVDQRFSALQVLEHPWVTVSPTVPLSCCFPTGTDSVLVLVPVQDEGLCENEHQLSVAGKIKKHFNTGPKGGATTAGVPVISVSPHRPDRTRTASCSQTSLLILLVSLCAQLDDSFSMQRSGSLDFYQHPAMYWIR